MKPINQIYGRVYNILRDKPTTRSDDKLLMLEVWANEGLHLTPEQQQLFMRVSSSESITRARRRIQTTGQFLANTAMRQRRLEQADNYKAELHNDTMAGRAISWLHDE